MRPSHNNAHLHTHAHWHRLSLCRMVISDSPWQCDYHTRWWAEVSFPEEGLIAATVTLLCGPFEGSHDWCLYTWDPVPRNPSRATSNDRSPSTPFAVCFAPNQSHAEDTSIYRSWPNPAAHPTWATTGTCTPETLSPEPRSEQQVMTVDPQRSLHYLPPRTKAMQTTVLSVYSGNF